MKVTVSSVQQPGIYFFYCNKFLFITNQDHACGTGQCSVLTYRHSLTCIQVPRPWDFPLFSETPTEVPNTLPAASVLNIVHASFPLSPAKPMGDSVKANA